MSTRYVYSVAAVRARLRRGAKEVLLCEPYTCRLLKVTKDNLPEVIKYLKANGRQC